jgi:hypothetical protein
LTDHWLGCQIRASQYKGQIRKIITFDLIYQKNPIPRSLSLQKTSILGNHAFNCLFLANRKSNGASKSRQKKPLIIEYSILYSHVHQFFFNVYMSNDTVFAPKFISEKDFRLSALFIKNYSYLLSFYIEVKIVRIIVSIKLCREKLN